MNSYSRMLISDIEVEHFVDNVLKITDMPGKRRAINLIAKAERNKRGYEEVQTLDHKDNRDFKYRDERVREQLRKEILNELIDKKRLDDDNKIKLGHGGAAPCTEVMAQKKVFYIIGPPAAGKSTISNTIADAVGAYILDSDYAKRKLPEYRNQISAASLVHEESAALVFTYRGGNLWKYCADKGYNMVIPKIGGSIGSIYKSCDVMKQVGYSVFLISVDLDRAKATQRAYNRFRESKRYVPLASIFDECSNEPTLNYFKIKQRYSDMFDGFAQFSSDVWPSVLVEQSNLDMFCDLFGGVVK